VVKLKSPNELVIRENQLTILVLIYRYRCLSNEHLAKIIYKNNPSNIETKKSNVSRQITILKNYGMIDSEKSLKNSKELFHFLTSKGVEYVKRHLEIDRQNSNAGFGRILGDFNAQQLKKINSNMEHYKIFLDLVTKSNTLSKFNIRHNLYSVRKYGINDRVRPDGELQLLGDPDQLCALECDTGTERYSQLLEKFNNYKRYFDYCNENNQKIPWVAILFVRNKEHKSYKSDERWHTIIKAAIEGLGDYCFKISVIIDATYLPFNFLKHLLKNDKEKLRSIGINITDDNNLPKLKTEIGNEENNNKFLLERDKNRDEIIKLELENESLRRWIELPDEQKLKKIGILKKEQDVEKREAFINDYVEKNFEKRKIVRFPLLVFND
jgi:DNA-binding MarR family transcriptional regulator